MDLASHSMPRAHRPSTPADELAAIVSRQGSAPRGILTEDLVAFCRSGISIVVATCGTDGAPIAGLALGCDVDEAGGVRILLLRAANEALLRSLETGSGIAATFSRPADHRSIQVKGREARRVSLRAGDQALLLAQCAGMARELRDVGYPDAFAAGYCAFDLADMVAVEFTPYAVFVQTPGPGAGSELHSSEPRASEPRASELHSSELHSSELHSSALRADLPCEPGP
jgi:hypothetical protein